MKSHARGIRTRTHLRVCERAIKMVPRTTNQSQNSKTYTFILWGGGGEGRSTFQILILSPNLLKSQIPHVQSFAESFCHDFIISCGIHFEYSMVPVHHVCAEP